jgi:hypothetical protein
VAEPLTGGLFGEMKLNKEEHPEKDARVVVAMPPAQVYVW